MTILGVLRVGILLGFFAAAALAAPPATTIGRVVVSDGQGFTRVAIELTREAPYEVFLLDEPNRLVVSFASARWSGGVAAGAAGVVAGYRPPAPDGERARIVFDLARPAKLRQASFARARGTGGLLVLELEPVSLDAFRALVRPWIPTQAGDVAAAIASAPTQLAAVAPRPGQPRAAPRPQPPLPMILLDPGHGGADPGATSRSGSAEKAITLAMARELRRQLEATGRYRVRLTRDADEFLALRDRLAIARANDADLFISLHADSMHAPDVRGLSVYTLSETASDEEAAAFALRENRADLLGGVDLSRQQPQVASILIDLAQRETMNRSVGFARMLVAELGREIELLPSNPHRFAGFAVLRAPDVPSVLIELGYLSNRAEERRLTSVLYRRDLARGVVRAIDHYFGEGRRPR